MFLRPSPTIVNNSVDIRSLNGSSSSLNGSRRKLQNAGSFWQSFALYYVFSDRLALPYSIAFSCSRMADSDSSVHGDVRGPPIPPLVGESSDEEDISGDVRGAPIAAGPVAPAPVPGRAHRVPRVAPVQGLWRPPFLRAACGVRPSPPGSLWRPHTPRAACGVPTPPGQPVAPVSSQGSL